MSVEDLLSDNEMNGFLSGLPQWLSEEQRVKAVVEHFFTHVLYRDFPSEFGLKFAENLLKFIEKARKEKI
jgi:hypothetical protein